MKSYLFSLSVMGLFFTYQGAVAANSWNIQTEMNADGESVCAWQNYDGTAFDIQTVTISNTGVISTPIELGIITSSIDTNPVVAINDLGKIVIIWTAVDYDLRINVLHMNYFDGTTWLPISLRISEDTENVDNINYNVRLSNADWVVITWSSYSNVISDNVVRAVYGTLGSLTGPVTLGFP